MTEYQKRKTSARNRAAEWQSDFENHNYTWGEISDIQDSFRKIGKRYGLLKEFKENGIL